MVPAWLGMIKVVVTSLGHVCCKRALIAACGLPSICHGRIWKAVVYGEAWLISIKTPSELCETEGLDVLNPHLAGQN